MSFDLAMKVTRLSVSSVALIAAAWIVQRVARPSRYAALAFGVVMLLVFIPIHIQLWPKFPLWYHAFFLASLVVIPQLTAMIVARAPEPSAAAVH
jgi:hypothetical protein